MTILGRFPLYLSFLMIVLASSVLVGFITYFLQVDKVIAQQQQVQQARVAHRLSELQGTLSGLNRLQDNAGVQRELVRLVDDPTLQFLVLLDDALNVRFSSDNRYWGRTADEISEVDALTLIGENVGVRSWVRVVPDGRRIIGSFPLNDALDSDAGEEGLLLVGVFDISGAIQQALFQQQRNIVQQVVIYMIVLVLAFLLLYGNIRSRFNRIMRTTRQFIAGDYSSRIALDGNDEFASIARTFDQMAKEIQAQHTNLNHLAHFDALTGLVNRPHFVELLALRINQPKAPDCSVLFLDLDRFKVVNDTLGHHMGDEMLKVIAHRIQSNVKDIDTVARLGGDEFVLLVESTENQVALRAILERLLLHIAEPMMLGGHPVTTTASIGVARFPSDGKTAQQLIQRADIAMYQAKSHGKNTYHFYRSDTDAPAPGRLGLEHHLRQCIKSGDINLYYQPIYDARRQRLMGLEALAYLYGERGEILPPDRVIPVIEEAGLMSQFGTLVLRHAMAEYQAWVTRRRPDHVPYLALNLACSQLDAPDFLDQVDAAIRETGINPLAVEFEITESAVISQVDQKLELLKAIRARGIRIAIDDFGTGYSSLSYLARLPLDTLKIDRSFVHDIHIDTEDNAIVEAIIAMAAKLGLGVVAEGVETSEQLAFLLDHQCDVIQGYYFDRPAPLESIWRDEPQLLPHPVT